MKKLLLIATIALVSACGTSSTESKTDSTLTKSDSLKVDSLKSDTTDKK